MTERQFQAHFAMDGKYAPTAPKVLTRQVHLMLFHSVLTGTTPPSGALWPLSGGGKWRTNGSLIETASPNELPHNGIGRNVPAIHLEEITEKF